MNGWTPERKRQQAKAIKTWQPWLQFKAQNWVQRDNGEIIDDGWKGPTTNHH